MATLRTRFTTAIAAALLAAACGGGGGSKPAPTTPNNPPPAETPPANGGGDDNLTTFFLDLDSDSNIIPALKMGAQAAGCEVVGEQANAVAAKCPGGTIAILQDGKKLGVGCQEIDEAACRQVFAGILQAAMDELKKQGG